MKETFAPSSKDFSGKTGNHTNTLNYIEQAVPLFVGVDKISPVFSSTGGYNLDTSGSGTAIVNVHKLKRGTFR